jgi:hypothetical protein
VVGELLGDAHLRIEAPLFGHVADAAPRRERQGNAGPANHARVGVQHAEHDPHRRRLAGPVAPDEAEHLSRADLEAQIIEGDDVTVSLGEPIDLERPVSHGSASRRSRAIAPASS